MAKAQKLATCYRELRRKPVPHSNPPSKALQQDRHQDQGDIDVDNPTNVDSTSDIDVSDFDIDFEI